MKYKYLLLISFIFTSALSAKTHFNQLPQQWQGKELTPYSDELFANTTMFNKLLANHYLKGDFKDDYEFARIIASEVADGNEFDQITNPLRKRKFLRENVVPKLKDWAIKNKGEISRPEYVLYRLPHNAIEVTSVYSKLETWLRYTPYTKMHGGYMWSGKGFGLNSRVNQQTIGNSTYTFCDNRFSLKFPDYYLGNTSVDVEFPTGLRSSVGQAGRDKSCTYIYKSPSENAAIDLLDEMEKGITVYWVMKLPKDSFNTVYKKVEKSGTVSTEINTFGKAVVEGLLVKGSEGQPLLAWTSGENAVSIVAGKNTAPTEKQEKSRKKEAKTIRKITIWEIRDGDRINWNGTSENVLVIHRNGEQSALSVDHKEWNKYKSTQPMIQMSQQTRAMIYEGKPFRKGFLSLFN